MSKKIPDLPTISGLYITVYLPLSLKAMIRLICI